MIFDGWIIVALWTTFVLYWIISAVGVKKNIQTKEWRRDAGIRILVIIVVIILIQTNSSVRLFGYRFDLIGQVAGIIFCVAGIAFAIWARRCLGKNWSGTPSIKEGHELITSGPYRFVRHPIYTGMLLAILGSALASSMVWFVIFIVFCVNFLYRIQVEERYMMQLFPNRYPEYRRRTKALIPFVW